MKQFICSIINLLFRREKITEEEAEFLGYESFSRMTESASKAAVLSRPEKYVVEK